MFERIQTKAYSYQSLKLITQTSNSEAFVNSDVSLAQNAKLFSIKCLYWVKNKKKQLCSANKIFVPESILVYKLINNKIITNSSTD